MKQKLLSTAIALTMATGLTSLASADSFNHAKQLYIAPNMGAFVDFSNRIGSSPMLGLAVGYNYTNNIAIQFAGNGGATANDIRLEGIWNIPTNTHWTPYLAAGAGYFHLGNQSFGVSAGGGVKYDVDKNIGLSLNYRFLQGIYSGAPNGSLINAGITFSFGGSDRIPAATVATPVTPAKKEKEMHAKYALPKNINECTEDTSEITKESSGCYTVNDDKATMHLDVKFTFDKSAITPQSKDAIMGLVNFLKQYPKTSLTLNGYASNEGTQDYNMKLSVKRALAVKQFIIANGIDASRIETKGFGFTNPVASNKTSMGRAENRRVQTVLTVPMR